eukprot:1098762-Pleurochrysis_carterae.AAC.2
MRKAAKKEPVYCRERANENHAEVPKVPRSQKGAVAWCHQFALVHRLLLKLMVEAAAAACSHQHARTEEARVSCSVLLLVGAAKRGVERCAEIGRESVCLRQARVRARARARERARMRARAACACASSVRVRVCASERASRARARTRLREHEPEAGDVVRVRVGRVALRVDRRRHELHALRRQASESEGSWVGARLQGKQGEAGWGAQTRCRGVVTRFRSRSHEINAT